MWIVVQTALLGIELIWSSLYPMKTGLFSISRIMKKLYLVTIILCLWLSLVQKPGRQYWKVWAANFDLSMPWSVFSSFTFLTGFSFLLFVSQVVLPYQHLSRQKRFLKQLGIRHATKRDAKFSIEKQSAISKKTDKQQSKIKTSHPWYNLQVCVVVTEWYIQKKITELIWVRTAKEQQRSAQNTSHRPINLKNNISQLMIIK